MLCLRATTVKGNSFVADKPRVWLAKPGGTDFDLSPDGNRLAVVTPVATTEAPKPEHEVVFLENFFDELPRRVPTSKWSFRVLHHQDSGRAAVPNLPAGPLGPSLRTRMATAGRRRGRREARSLSVGAEVSGPPRSS
jgi:hypothetical protein